MNSSLGPLSLSQAMKEQGVRGKGWASPPDWAVQNGNADHECWPRFSNCTLYPNPTLEAVCTVSMRGGEGGREGRQQRHAPLSPEPLFPSGISRRRLSTLGVKGWGAPGNRQAGWGNSAGNWRAQHHTCWRWSPGRPAVRDGWVLGQLQGYWWHSAWPLLRAPSICCSAQTQD